MKSDIMNDEQKTAQTLVPRRRRRGQRTIQPPAMRLTQRDKQIVEAVKLFRVLRQDQIQALFFGSKTATQRRLALLYDHGFLERQFLPVRGGILNSPILYLLDKRGAEMLRAEFGYDDLNWNPRNNQVGYEFLDHTLAINDVRISVSLACRDAGYQIQIWQDEADLKADYDYVTLRPRTGKPQKVSVIPDSFFVLQTPHGRAPFFLELDRGTMTTKRFRTKIEAYIAYLASGQYQQRFQVKSLRVLTVTLGAQRCNNLKRVTEEAGGKQWFYFATLAELSWQKILYAPVWQVAGFEGYTPLITISR